MSITKDQINRLTSEQQETLASIECQRLNKRQRLLDQMGGHKVGQGLGAFVGFGVAALLPSVAISDSSLTYQKYAAGILCGGLAFALFVMQLQFAGLHRRLDALLEFLETEKLERD